jgi:diguanylate cyclase (GGDEF)-like protein/PAS domain S-box-containing protein
MTMQQPDNALLQQVVDLAPAGIAICDVRAPDQPVVKVNAALEQMTGYAAAEIVGTGLRLLHGADEDQQALQLLRGAFERREAARILLRNYRRNGELFWNEMVLQPLRDAAGEVSHMAVYCHDMTARLRQSDRPEGVPVWLREDRVTGVSSREWFRELLAREWRISRREGKPLSLVLFDVDALASYSATYGRSGGDACLKRIARSIASGFRRGSDVVGMWREGCIAVLAVHRDGQGVANVVEHAGANVRRIAEMRIHHPRSPLQKFVTVTAGLATVTPGRDEEEAQRLIARAEAALSEAKKDLRGGLNQAPD